MKTNKIYLGLLFSAMVLLFANCTIREGEMAGAATQRGYEIYKTCESNTLYFIDNKVDICFKLNAWLEADSSLKDLLEDKWFPNYKIRKMSDGMYGLYAGADLAYSIETGNLPLSDPSAQWILSWRGTERDLPNYYDRPYALTTSFIQGTQELHVDHTDSTNSWHVTIAGVDSSDAFLDLNIVTLSRLMPQSLIDDDFTVTGTGKFEFLEGRIWKDGDYSGWQHHTCLSFDIKEPMQNFFAYEGLDWNGGKMDLEASNENGDKLSVNAEFKGPYNLRITYKGKVQIWNVNTEQVTEIF